MFYKYIIKLEGSEEKTIDVRLDPETLTVVPQAGAEPPAWALLDFCKCPVCPFDSSEVKHCPVASNLAEVTRLFSDQSSVTTVEARVVTQQREYYKRTNLQTALSSVIGIYMVTSGCPVTAPLKPMARHHLPFATLDETVYRSVSSYLLLQYLRKQKGLAPDWELRELTKAYKAVESLNLAMTDRVRKASQKDANYNAVIILDAFAKMVPWTIERGLPIRDFPVQL